MKKILVIITATVISFFLFRQLNLGRNKKQESIHPIIESVTPISKPLINVVFFQDVSLSIKKNGVELISSSVFAPYYNSINRNIKISFGCIADLSARKLISNTLPAITFSKPALPDLNNASITDKMKLKELYVKDLKNYEHDSSQYFSDRHNRFTEFCKRVDSLVGLYKDKLSTKTDISTAINIADKVFNFSGNDSVRNILILNSDGMDTYKRPIRKMKNKATVILVNADGINHTSVDSIITTTLQDSEQAIQYSLIN